MSSGLLNNLFDYGMGGILRKPLKQATGMTDAQLGGLGLLAAGGFMAAPALMAGGAGAGASAGAAEAGATGAASAHPASSGLMSFMQPAAMGMNIAGQVRQMDQGSPIQPGQLQPHQGPDMSGVMSAQAQAQSAIDAERQRRLQQQQMAMQGLFGGGYGRNA